MGLTITLEDRVYSAIDYMHLYSKERLELIRGNLRKMSPAPGSMHQRMTKKIFLELGNDFQSQPKMVVLFALLDVYLNEHTVVQPDVLVCQESQISDRGCEGAPFLVVEVVSPSSKIYDEGTKVELYKENGVEEYWLAYPESGKLEKHHFSDS